MTLGTLLWLRQVGVADKYIQQDEEDQELAFQKAFTLELLLTGVSMLVLLALLPLVVVVYDEAELLLPGLVVIMMLPAGALQMPVTVYYRRMQFVRQRTLQMVEPIVAFVAAVALAAAGAGYWALVGGLFTGAWTGALVAVLRSPYPLRYRYDGAALRSYASFSWPLFAASASAVLIAQSATLATDAHLGIAAVGALALSSQITQFTDRVDSLVTGTLYPAICAVRDRADVLYESFVKSNRLALMWALPFGFGVSLFAGDLVDFVIGDKWEPAVGLLQVTGAVAAIGHIGFNWSAYFRAIGDTRPMAVASVVAAVTFFATGLPLLFAYGLDGLAAGIGFQMAAHVVCRAYYLQRFFHGFGFVWHATRALLPTVPAALAVLALRQVESGERTASMAIVELGAYLGITVVATWLLENRLLREAVGYLRSVRPAGVAA